jgi:hypothetical protein
MKFDFNNFNNDGGKASVDSGTTFVYFPPDLYQAFKLSWANFCRGDANRCARISDFQTCYTYQQDIYPSVQAFLDTFPPISYQFKGDNEFVWTPKDYLYVDETPQSYCIGIQPLKDLVFGEIFMKNWDIRFDLDNRQLGFAKSNCAKGSGSSAGALRSEGKLNRCQ